MAAKKSAPRPSQSENTVGRNRFLSHVVEHALQAGLRSPADFIRQFPPAALMEALSKQPGLRADILVPATGLKRRVAMKKSWQSAAEDLELALSENETDGKTIVEAFSPDERVRYLDRSELWRFVVESAFWNASPLDRAAHTMAKEQLCFILERALTDALITPADVVQGVTVAELAARLPREEFGRVIEAVLERGRAKQPFTEQELLAAVPSASLVDCVPLPHLWQSVIDPKIAIAHGLAAEPSEAAPEPLDAVVSFEHVSVSEIELGQPEAVPFEHLQPEFLTDVPADSADAEQPPELAPIAAAGRRQDDDEEELETQVLDTAKLRSTTT
jgi:hypothetical protein